MVIGLTKTITIACSTPNVEEGAKYFADTKEAITSLGKRDQYLSIARVLNAPQSSRPEILAEHGLSSIGDAAVIKGSEIAEEKIKAAKEVKESTLDFLSMGDSFLDTPAKRVAAGVAGGALLIAAGVMMAPVATVVVAHAAAHLAAAKLAYPVAAMGVKIASVIGGASVSLMKEYFDPPTELADRIKHSKEDASLGLVKLTAVQDKLLAERLSKLEASTKDPEILKSETEKLKRGAAVDSINEVKRTIEFYYSGSNQTDDVSFMDRWKMRGLLKYQKYDDLVKFTDQVAANYAKVDGKHKFSYRESFELAHGVMMSDPDGHYKTVAENWKGKLLSNVGKITASTAAAWALGGLLGGGAKQVVEAGSGFAHKVASYAAEKIVDVGKDIGKGSVKAAATTAANTAIDIISDRLGRWRANNPTQASTANSYGKPATP